MLQFKFEHRLQVLKRRCILLYLFDAEMIFFIYYVKLCENKSGTEINSTCDLVISASAVN